MTLWGGRFSTKLNEKAWALNTSLPFDKRMALQDVRGSIAWANAIRQAGVLTAEEVAQICAALESVYAEFENGVFEYQESDEDIHTAVERRLGELIGATAGKLHTGRSRNDQVATDFRLWMLDVIPELGLAIKGLQTTLVELAEQNQSTLMPGYTHLQRAQPITLAHWLMAHFWALQRDRERLEDLKSRVSVLPLGSGAMAGTAFEIDRYALADVLGFNGPCFNSIDGVSDRDFAAEFLFFAAMCGVHLSRLGESVVLFTSAEFGFFELSDAFSTGSSLMPQKKNADVFELARGKSGTLTGYLSGLLATLKGLPSTYDKDLQEDKVPVFNAADTLLSILPVMAGAFKTMTFHPERMAAAIDASMLATDLADYLVNKGMPFREAHVVAGKAVRLAVEKGVGLDQLTLNDWQALGPFDADVASVFDPFKSIQNRKAIGGTAPDAVREQIKIAKSKI